MNNTPPPPTESTMAASVASAMAVLTAPNTTPNEWIHTFVSLCNKSNNDVKTDALDVLDSKYLPSLIQAASSSSTNSPHSYPLSRISTSVDPHLLDTLFSTLISLLRTHITRHNLLVLSILPPFVNILVPSKHLPILCPVLIDKLGDSKDRVREGARKLLETIFAAQLNLEGASSSSSLASSTSLSVSDNTKIVEKYFKDAITSKSWRVREQGILLMGDLNGLVWVGGVVKALEDSNEAVRYAARDAIPRIYNQTDSRNIKSDIRKVLMKSNIRQAILDTILGSLNDDPHSRANTHEDFHTAPPSHHQSTISLARSESTSISTAKRSRHNSTVSLNHHQNNNQQNLPALPKAKSKSALASSDTIGIAKSMTVSMHSVHTSREPPTNNNSGTKQPDPIPITVRSKIEFENYLKTFLDTFQGKETDANWESRERALQTLRCLVRGNGMKRYPDVWCSGMSIHGMMSSASSTTSLSASSSGAYGYLKSIVEALNRTLTSLRTALVITALASVSDLYLYTASTACQPDVLSTETLLTTLMKLLSQTKKLVVNHTATTLATVLWTGPSISPKYFIMTIIHHYFLQEKNPTVRFWIVKSLWTLLDRDRVMKSVTTGNVLFAPEVDNHHHHHHHHSSSSSQANMGSWVIEKVLTKALSDASPLVREAGRELWWLWRKLSDSTMNSNSKRPMAFMEILPSPTQKGLLKYCPVYISLKASLEVPYDDDEEGEVDNMKTPTASVSTYSLRGKRVDVSETRTGSLESASTGSLGDDGERVFRSYDDDDDVDVKISQKSYHQPEEPATPTITYPIPQYLPDTILKTVTKLKASQEKVRDEDLVVIGQVILKLLSNPFAYTIASTSNSAINNNSNSAQRPLDVNVFTKILDLDVVDKLLDARIVSVSVLMKGLIWLTQLESFLVFLTKSGISGSTESLDSSSALELIDTGLKKYFFGVRHVCTQTMEYIVRTLPALESLDALSIVIRGFMKETNSNSTWVKNAVEKALKLVLDVVVFDSEGLVQRVRFSQPSGSLSGNSKEAISPLPWLHKLPEYERLLTDVLGMQTNGVGEHCAATVKRVMRILEEVKKVVKSGENSNDQKKRRVSSIPVSSSPPRKESASGGSSLPRASPTISTSPPPRKESLSSSSNNGPRTSPTFTRERGDSNSNSLSAKSTSALNTADVYERLAQQSSLTSLTTPKQQGQLGPARSAYSLSVTTSPSPSQSPSLAKLKSPTPLSAGVSPSSPSLSPSSASSRSQQQSSVNSSARPRGFTSISTVRHESVSSIDSTSSSSANNRRHTTGTSPTRLQSSPAPAPLFPLSATKENGWISASKLQDLESISTSSVALASNSALNTPPKPVIGSKQSSTKYEEEDSVILPVPTTSARPLGTKNAEIDISEETLPDAFDEHNNTVMLMDEPVPAFHESVDEFMVRTNSRLNSKPANMNTNMNTQSTVLRNRPEIVLENVGMVFNENDRTISRSGSLGGNGSQQNIAAAFTPKAKGARWQKVPDDKLFAASTPPVKIRSPVEDYLLFLPHIASKLKDYTADSGVFRKLIRMSRDPDREVAKQVWDKWFDELLDLLLDFLVHGLVAEQKENCLLTLKSLLDHQSSYFAGYESHVLLRLLKCRSDVANEIAGACDAALDVLVLTLDRKALMTCLIEYLSTVTFSALFKPTSLTSGYQRNTDSSEWKPSPESSAYTYLSKLFRKRYTANDMNELEPYLTDASNLNSSTSASPNRSIMHVIVKGLNAPNPDIRKSAVDSILGLSVVLKEGIWNVFRGNLTPSQVKLVQVYLERFGKEMGSNASVNVVGRV